LSIHHTYVNTNNTSGLSDTVWIILAASVVAIALGAGYFMYIRL